MKIYEVKSNNDIKRLHKFFYMLDKSFVPSLREYKDVIKRGEAWIVMDNDNVVGGLVQISEHTHNTVVNYYVPKGKRHSKMYLIMLKKLVDFKDRNPNRKTYIKSNDVSEYRRLTTHIKRDIYELHIPTSRFI